MRNMSYQLTTAQAYAQLKNITRRLGWWNLRTGDLVQQVEKGMGLKKGETIKRIYKVKVETASPEPLNRILIDQEYGRLEVIREGFPWMAPDQFVSMFCKSHKGCTPETTVNRISFSYCDSVYPCNHCLETEWTWLGNGPEIVCTNCHRKFPMEASIPHRIGVGE